MNAAERLDAFAAQFGEAFLTGDRPAVISAPLADAGYDAVRVGIATHTGLSDAMQRQFVQLARLTDVPPTGRDDEAGTLLYAIHELMATTHPGATRVLGFTHRFADAATSRVRALGFPRTAGSAVLRHALISRLISAQRRDIELSWWTGKKRFLGTVPPARLEAWPALRRVSRQAVHTPMWVLAREDSETKVGLARRRLLTALMEASPLTWLLSLGDDAQTVLAPSLVLTRKVRGRRASPVFILEDRRLARAVTDHLLLRGADKAGAALGRAVHEAAHQNLAPFAQLRAGELAVHLVMAMAQVEAHSPGQDEAAPLRGLLDDDPSEFSDVRAPFWALVRAMHQLAESVITLPPSSLLGEAAADVYRSAATRLSHPDLAAQAEDLRVMLERNIARAGLARKSAV